MKDYTAEIEETSKFLSGLDENLLSSYMKKGLSTEEAKKEILNNEFRCSVVKICSDAIGSIGSIGSIVNPATVVAVEEFRKKFPKAMNEKV